MSKLDDILVEMKIIGHVGRKQQIKDLMLELMKETWAEWDAEDDDRPYRLVEDFGEKVDAL